MPIRHVGIMYLPRQGTLSDHIPWWEPYDRQIAGQALTRLGSIHQALTLYGNRVLSVLDRVNDYCESCPFFRPRIDTPEAGCPGAPETTRDNRTSHNNSTGSRSSGPDPILDLL